MFGKVPGMTPAEQAVVDAALAFQEVYVWPAGEGFGFHYGRYKDARQRLWEACFIVRLERDANDDDAPRLEG